MRDRFDLAVRAAIMLGVVACLVAAFVRRTGALPPSAVAPWSPERRAQRTMSAIQTLRVAGQDQPYTGWAVGVPIGTSLGVRGWALDPVTRRTADRVVYRVDEGRWIDALYHLPYPDVRADAGFRADISVTGLRPVGYHSVHFATIVGTGPRRVLPDFVAFTVID